MEYSAKVKKTSKLKQQVKRQQQMYQHSEVACVCVWHSGWKSKNFVIRFVLSEEIFPLVYVRWCSYVFTVHIVQNSMLEDVKCLNRLTVHSAHTISVYRQQIASMRFQGFHRVFGSICVASQSETQIETKSKTKQFSWHHASLYTFTFSSGVTPRRNDACSLIRSHWHSAFLTQHFFALLCFVLFLYKGIGWFKRAML